MFLYSYCYTMFILFDFIWLQYYILKLCVNFVWNKYNKLFDFITLIINIENGFCCQNIQFWYKYLYIIVCFAIIY